MCEIIMPIIMGLGSCVTTNKISLTDSRRNMMGDWVMLREVESCKEQILIF